MVLQGVFFDCLCPVCLLPQAVSSLRGQISCLLMTGLAWAGLVGGEGLEGHTVPLGGADCGQRPSLTGFRLFSEIISRFITRRQFPVHHREAQDFVHLSRGEEAGRESSRRRAGSIWGLGWWRWSASPAPQVSAPASPGAGRGVGPG